MSALYDAAGQGDAVVQFVQTSLAALLVIRQVGGDVVIEVTFPQDVPVLLKGHVAENLLISRDDRVHVGNLSAGGVLAIDNPDCACGILP